MTKTIAQLASDARTQGLTTFLGPACKNCSGVERYTAGAACVRCVRDRASDRNAARPKRPRVLKTEEEKAATRRASDREYRKRNRAKVRKAKAAYRAANPDVVQRYQAKYQAQNVEKERARKVQWAKDNREKIRAYRHKRRAVHGFHSAAQLTLLKELQGHRCAYCDADAEHLDHKTPISRGGSNWPWNLQWLCAFHNVSKCDKTDEEYRELHGFPPAENNPFHVLALSALEVDPDAPPAPKERKVKPKVQGETLAPAPALPPMGDGQALDVHALGQALGAALVDAGRMHVALTQLEGGQWQVVTLKPGYKGQVTRCSSDAGEALALALQGTRGRVDELLDVVG